jgi:preprotein translocase subunit SecD
MTAVEDRLRQLLDDAAPMSSGVDSGEVARQGRRLRRRRSTVMTGVAAVTVAAVAIVTVLATRGSSSSATVSPRPNTTGLVTRTLTPVSRTATADDLRRDAAVLTQRLASARIDGRAEVAGGSITLHLPPSAVDSVSYLAGTGQLSFRVPSAVNPTPTRSVEASGCSTAAGPGAGEQPRCVTTGLSTSCRTQPVTETPTVPIVACDVGGTTAFTLGPERLNGDAVASATASLNSGPDGIATGEWIVTLRFTATGQRAWTDLTRAVSSSPGCPDSMGPTCLLAIVVNGVVESAPVIQQTIPGPAQITGTFTEQSAKALAAVISSGPLPTPLKVEAS